MVDSGKMKTFIANDSFVTSLGGTILEASAAWGQLVVLGLWMERYNFASNDKRLGSSPSKVPHSANIGHGWESRQLNGNSPRRRKTDQAIGETIL